MEEVKCKLCGKVIGPSWKTNGNTHQECYWKWVHGTLWNNGDNSKQGKYEKAKA